jgi:hypothetical protein
MKATFQSSVEAAFKENLKHIQVRGSGGRGSNPFYYVTNLHDTNLKNLCKKLVTHGGHVMSHYQQWHNMNVN